MRAGPGAWAEDLAGQGAGTEGAAAGRMGGRGVAAGARQGAAGEVRLAGHGRQPAAATARSARGLVDVYARLSFRLCFVAETVTHQVTIAGAGAGTIVGAVAGPACPALCLRDLREGWFGCCLWVCVGIGFSSAPAIRQRTRAVSFPIMQCYAKGGARNAAPPVAAGPWGSVVRSKRGRRRNLHNSSL